MAIIVGDIHGDLKLAKAFLSYRPLVTHVALGDLVDSRKGASFQEEQECLDLLLTSQVIPLWGNHDLSYTSERPWRCYGRYGEMAFREQFQKHKDRFTAAYAVDGWVCTHACVSPGLVKLMPVEIVAGGVVTVVAWLNQEFVRQFRTRNPDVASEPRYGRGPLFQIPICRGGNHAFGGIFWFDDAGEQSQPSPLVGPQIFGHSPVLKPQRGESWVLQDGNVVSGKSWINLNATDGSWIYDTETDEFVDVS